MTKRVAVIDGNSLMHRAYHAVPPTMNMPDGTPTNAVFGFCSMLFKFIELANPDAIICAFDAGKPRFRIEAMEQYKAQRPKMDEELRVQFPLIESLLEAMNIPVVKVEGWEGDDILGTVAARDEAHGYETLLVSGDKDINQLVTDKTRVVTTKKGITDVVIFDPEEVFAKYGVTPAQFPDYLGFMGDSSDNIPGVPGVGPKSASKLLAQFGSMEGVYENLDKLKGKQLENIRDNRDLAFLSRKVATIVTDLDFDLDVDDVSWPSFEYEKVNEAFGALHFNAQLTRLYSIVGAEDVPAEHETFEIAIPVAGEEAKKFAEDALANKERVALSFMRSSQASLFGDEACLALATSAGAALLKDEEATCYLIRFIKEGSFAAADVKSLMHEVYAVDSSVPTELTREDLVDANFFDLSVAAYDIDSSRSDYSVPELMRVYCDRELPDANEDEMRLSIEAQAVNELWPVISKKLDTDGIRPVYDDIDGPLVPVLAIIERNGAPIDSAALDALGKSAQAHINALQVRIYELAGEEFNIDSPKQLGHILFEVLELPHGKKNHRGYSTDAKVLKNLAEIHELPALVIQYREFSKIKSTYIDALPHIAKRYGDGRVHTSFNETVTTTGRLSSSDPNLQNIPVRTDFGRQIRACFGAYTRESLFMSADYSQIELRLLAHLSGDEHLIAAFNSGTDFHANTASRVFDVPLHDVTSAMRARAKAVNFGIVYGQQAFGLSQSLEIPVSEAREMIERYFEAYPGVRAYLDKTVEEARERGYAETMFGRRRYIPELKSGNAIQRGFGERTAMNHPMQGSAADIIKMAMNEVVRRFVEEDYESRLLLQVHDELDFSVPKSELERVSSVVKEIMENVVSLRVPLVVDVGAGDNWAEAH